jgi:hypothetical protein
MYCGLCFRLSLIRHVLVGLSSRYARTRLWAVWGARQLNNWTIVPIISLSLSIYIMSCMKWWILVCLTFHIISLVFGLHMGSIVLLSVVVIALMLSRYSYCKMSYGGLWSSILRDVIWPIVLRCRDLSKVMIWWGKLLPSRFVNGSCSNQLRTGS